MVSLNEKRSKVRYIVQNKTEWTEDGNKFGQRMLEKMGWKTGAGLGKNEDGRTDHIDMKFKANLKGVGFVNGKYDSTWIAHSQSYDSLLQQLQESHPSSTQSTLNNLHETVKQTKTRFNYKKQSSGKDLSSRSHHELDCIFGWNKGNQIKNEEAKEKEEEEAEEEETATKNDETTSDANLYTISKQSMHDYFKEKSRKKAQLLHEKSRSSTDDQINKAEENSSSEEEKIDNSVENETMNQEVEPSSKTKREKSSDDTDEIEKVHKKKKHDQSDIQNPYEGSNVPDLEGYQGWNIESSFEDVLKKKEKRKKRKK